MTQEALREEAPIKQKRREHECSPPYAAAGNLLPLLLYTFFLAAFLAAFFAGFFAAFFAAFLAIKFSLRGCCSV